MPDFRRPEIDIQSVEAEVLAPMRRQAEAQEPEAPSAAAMHRVWREFHAREQWRAARLSAD
jgi:hypothetical protein